jgi:hypothetical protein
VSGAFSKAALSWRTASGVGGWKRALIVYKNDRNTIARRNGVVKGKVWRDFPGRWPCGCVGVWVCGCVGVTGFPRPLAWADMRARLWRLFGGRWLRAGWGALWDESGLQAVGRVGVFFPGRWPGLTWGRAFGACLGEIGLRVGSVGASA